MKTKYWKYFAYVVGVKKRCRKSDIHHTKKLAELEILNEVVASELALAWAKENMKTIEKIQAVASLWTSDGPDMEQWEPMNEAHNYRKTLLI